jgi:CDGSH-type Zn-finger protein
VTEDIEVRITIRDNGPYRVEGPIRLFDAEGNEITTRTPPFSLCRCGGSTTKPFCDGTHSKIGFQAATRAVQQAEAQANPT